VILFLSIFFPVVDKDSTGLNSLKPLKTPLLDDSTRTYFL